MHLYITTLSRKLLIFTSEGQHYVHNMHPWALSLTKPSAQIRVLASQTLYSRSIFTKSNAAVLGSSRRYDENESKNGRSSLFLESLFRSVCYGVAVAGSSLGLYYCSSFSSGDSWVSYADSGSTQSVEPDKKPTFLFKDAYRRKVFFKYEKRIRTRSPPEKVFEYFASYKMPSGEAYMTAADLMRAVVPVFPPSEAGVVRGGYLKGETVTSELHCPPSEFFMLFDTDNDGLISFAEYIFFVTILSIPETSFSVAFKMFDLDSDGGIDKEEFKKVMSLMRTQNRQGASHRDGKRTGFRVSASVENGGLLQYFFGKDGNERLGHNRFVKFLRDLHDEMLRLEFAHYDFKSQGTISAKDFVLSMVASADMSYGKVNGLLSKPDFKRAADKVCGVSLTDKVVDLVFYMFDANRDGNLSADEFLRVLERRETDILQPREEGLAGMISCWLSHWYLFFVRDYSKYSDVDFDVLYDLFKPYTLGGCARVLSLWRHTDFYECRNRGTLVPKTLGHSCGRGTELLVVEPQHHSHGGCTRALLRHSHGGGDGNNLIVEVQGRLQGEGAWGTLITEVGVRRSLQGRS
ncbi:UNVERIFIED_CONTAM: Calcium uptake protein, mitochondrial [Sesamum angustifolium]|uniref:Calcium uptake protein, mitochondrial n=1 Tax=Sesamum angustifolium TaxID=2727405 RepID=A0AAW2PQ56_9LAMI